MIESCRMTMTVSPFGVVCKVMETIGPHESYTLEDMYAPIKTKELIIQGSNTDSVLKKIHDEFLLNRTFNETELELRKKNEIKIRIGNTMSKIYTAKELFDGRPLDIIEALWLVLKSKEIVLLLLV